MLIFNIGSWVFISKYLTFDDFNILRELFKTCLTSLILWFKISSKNFSFVRLGKLFNIYEFISFTLDIIKL